MIDREDGHHLEPEELAMMVSRGDGMTFKERQAAAKLIRGAPRPEERAQEVAVAWGPEKQDYPGGPVYRIGSSTGATLPPQPGDEALFEAASAACTLLADMQPNPGTNVAKVLAKLDRALKPIERLRMNSGSK